MSTKTTTTKGTTKGKTTNGKAPAKETAAAKKARMTALEQAARELTPAQLAERLMATRTGETKATEQIEHFRNMFEAAKLDASNKRVLLARGAYLLTSHPEVATKRFPLNASAAARVMAPEGTAAEREALRKWVAIQAVAGLALFNKGLVFNTAEPTEAERAIVEAAHDAGVRAESAKKNGKVREAAAKGKAAGKAEETDADGVIKSKVETVIPTAEGIIGGLETTLQNIRKFKTDARFSGLQTETVQELLDLIAAELGDDVEVDADGE